MIGRGLWGEGFFHGVGRFAKRGQGIAAKGVDAKDREAKRLGQRARPHGLGIGLHEDGPEPLGADRLGQVGQTLGRRCPALVLDRELPQSVVLCEMPPRRMVDEKRPSSERRQASDELAIDLADARLERRQPFHHGGGDGRGRLGQFTGHRAGHGEDALRTRPEMGIVPMLLLLFMRRLVIMPLLRRRNNAERRIERAELREKRSLERQTGAEENAAPGQLRELARRRLEGMRILPPIYEDDGLGAGKNSLEDAGLRRKADRHTRQGVGRRVRGPDRAGHGGEEEKRKQGTDGGHVGCAGGYSRLPLDERSSMRRRISSKSWPDVPRESTEILSMVSPPLCQYSWEPGVGP